MGERTRERKYLTAREVMEMTGLSRSSAYELMHSLGVVRPLGRAARLPKHRLDFHLLCAEHASPVQPKPPQAKYRGPGVYALEGAPHWIKIGKALNVAKRMKELQSGNPVPLRLLAVLSTNLDDEPRFHEQWKHLRSSGEWFRADAAMMAWLRTVGVKVP